MRGWRIAATDVDASVEDALAGNAKTKAAVENDAEVGARLWLHEE